MLSLDLEEKFAELASKLGLAIFLIVNLDWGHMDDIMALLGFWT